MMKCISILGSTGSIGRQSLDIISRLPQVKVAALTAGTSVDRMAQQCRKYLPQLAVMGTQEAAAELQAQIAEIGMRLQAVATKLNKLAEKDEDSEYQHFLGMHEEGKAGSIILEPRSRNTAPAIALAAFAALIPAAPPPTMRMS